MALKKQVHCVCDMKYHVVLVTKYRRPVLQYKEVSDRLKEECIRLIDRFDGEVIEMETDCDHIHILMALGPGYAIRNVINTLKGTTSYLLRRDYMDLIKPLLWGKEFWSNSYYCATCGGVTVDVIRKYVENQPKEKRGPGNPNLVSKKKKHI